ncbi:MAG: hypothetical protein ABR532_01975 [Candidatus Dormibacteria bacterium]
MPAPGGSTPPPAGPSIIGTPVGAPGSEAPGTVQVVGGALLLVLGFAVLANAGVRRWVIRLLR